MCFSLGSPKEFKDFFSKGVEVAFCNDVCSVMVVLVHEYNPDQWRIFIDSSNLSPKWVLLHKGNRFPSVSFVHATNMKVSFESIWEV